jgi:outer membrane protein assembly factor BamB
MAALGGVYHMRKYALTFMFFVITQTSCGSLLQPAEFLGFQEVVSNTLPVSLAWSYESPEPIRVPPRANHEVMVLLQTDGVFVALDLETGVVRWEYDSQSATNWPVSDTPYDVNDRILVTVIDNTHLVAVDVLNGKELWRSKLNVITSRMPDILLIEDVVIISSTSVKPTSEGYVAGYDLTTRELSLEQYYPSRLLYFSFHCPQYSQSTSEFTVCVALGDYLEVFDFDPRLQDSVSRKLDSRYGDDKFWSIDRPVFRQGLIFSNLSPQPANQVIDVSQDESFALYDNCQMKEGPPPVTEHEEMILVSTGCGELYTLDIGEVQEQPAWVFPATVPVRSSFVTVHGDVGYVLSSQAEIIGVDLSTGTVVGRFTTTPASLNKGKHLHWLASQDSYLYVFLNGRQILVFEQD